MAGNGEKLSDQELEQWTAEAVADVASSWGPVLEKALGMRPSDEDIWRIANRADVYTFLHQQPNRKFREACARAVKAADAFRKALADSEKYCATLVNKWRRESGADAALTRVQLLGRELGKGPVRRDKPNVSLRWLVAAVLRAYRSAGTHDKLGISTVPDSGKRVGPVLDAVKASLRLAGISDKDLPSDQTILDAARDVAREGG